jgi:hypothetical protein
MCSSSDLLEVAAAPADLQRSSRMNSKHELPAVLPRVLAFVEVFLEFFYVVIIKNFELGCTGASGPSPIYLRYTVNLIV